MAIRQATSRRRRGRRGMTAHDFAEHHQGKQPEKALTRAQDRDRRPQQPRPHHLALPRRRSQAAATASSTSSATRSACPAKVASIEYDPNRTARIALLHYADGEKRYILAPDGLEVGDTVVVGAQRRHQAGQLPAAARHPARHDDPQRRAARSARAAQLVRSAGAAAQLMAKEGDYAPGPPALGRGAHGPPRLPRHHRPGRQHRAREHLASARPAARAGWACARTTAASP